MQEIDINNLVKNNNYLIEDIRDDIIIIGKMNELIIDYKYETILY